MKYIAIDYQENILETLVSDILSNVEIDSYFARKYGDKYMGMFME